MSLDWLSRIMDYILQFHKVVTNISISHHIFPFRMTTQPTVSPWTHYIKFTIITETEEVSVEVFVDFKYISMFTCQPLKSAIKVHGTLITSLLSTSP